MSEIQMQFQQVDFFDDFHCTTSACRRNCCNEKWDIPMDKKHYKLLRGVREPKWLSENFGKYIKRTGTDNILDYARIVEGEQGGCNFQDEQGLCKIHAELGAEYLCRTCRVYPRMENEIAANYRQKSLTVSCEEVVRLLLAHHEPIRLLSTVRMLSASDYDTKIVAKSISDKNRLILRQFAPIQQAGLAILQNRAYNLEQRVILLTVLFQKLHAAEQEHREDEIPQLLQEMDTAVREHLLDGLLGESRVDSARSALGNRISLTLLPSYMMDDPVIQRCNRSIAASSYTEQRERADAFLKAREYFFENVLVTEYITSTAPFHAAYDIWQCAQRFAAMFTVLRYLLGLYLVTVPEPTDIELIDLVAVFGKGILHSRNSFPKTIELLQQNEMESLAHLIAAIKG